MYIFIKNYNGQLIFKMDDQIQFHILLEELKGLLKQSFFQRKNDYPIAFFDFKKRKLNEYELICLIDVLIESKTVLFHFYNQQIETNKHIHVLPTIRSGSILYINEDTIIEGNINPDTTIYLNAKLYVLKSTKGRIIALNKDTCISSRFDNAYIQYKDYTFKHYTRKKLTTLQFNDLIEEKEVT